MSDELRAYFAEPPTQPDWSGTCCSSPPGEEDEARPADKGEDLVVGCVCGRVRDPASKTTAERRKLIVSGRLGDVLPAPGR